MTEPQQYVAYHIEIPLDNKGRGFVVKGILQQFLSHYHLSGKITHFQSTSSLFSGDLVLLKNGVQDFNMATLNNFLSANSQMPPTKDRISITPITTQDMDALVKQMAEELKERSSDDRQWDELLQRQETEYKEKNREQQQKIQYLEKEGDKLRQANQKRQGVLDSKVADLRKSQSLIATLEATIQTLESRPTPQEISIDYQRIEQVVLKQKNALEAVTRDYQLLAEQGDEAFFFIWMAQKKRDKTTPSFRDYLNEKLNFAFVDEAHLESFLRTGKQVRDIPESVLLQNLRSDLKMTIQTRQLLEKPDELRKSGAPDFLIALLQGMVTDENLQEIEKGVKKERTYISLTKRLYEKIQQAKRMYPRFIEALKSAEQRVQNPLPLPIVFYNGIPQHSELRVYIPFFEPKKLNGYIWNVFQEAADQLKGFFDMGKRTSLIELQYQGRERPGEITRMMEIFIAKLNTDQVLKGLGLKPTFSDYAKLPQNKTDAI